MRKSDLILLDEKIQSFLHDKPDSKVKDVAAALALDERLVYNRIGVLQKRRELLHIYWRPPEQWEAYQQFWIFILTTHPRGRGRKADDYQAELCAEIKRKFINRADKHAKGIVFHSIQILFGANSDIMLSVLSRRADFVGQFVMRFLRRHPAVLSTQTAFALRSGMPITSLVPGTTGEFASKVPQRVLQVRGSLGQRPGS